MEVADLVDSLEQAERIVRPAAEIKYPAFDAVDPIERGEPGMHRIVDE